MRNFADLKRRLQVGTVLEMTWHLYDEPGATSLVGKSRVISRVQSNGVALETERNGRTFESSLAFNGARGFRIDGPSEFTVFDSDGDELIKYRIVTSQ